MARRRIRRADDKPFSDLTAIQAAERVLLDGIPLRLTELTLEVQRRGCRPGDDPRKLAHSIENSMLYHGLRFKRDKAGRWTVASS